MSDGIHNLRHDAENASKDPPAGGSVIRYWHTLRPLRASQIAYNLLRRAFPLPFGEPVVNARACDKLKAPRFADPVAPGIRSGEIAFLNRTRSLHPEDIDWVSSDWPKLWRYNLHYFDYLGWPVYEGRVKGRLIDSWILAHPVPAGDGWEPYPLSLRAVNWIKFWLPSASRSIPQSWLDSLAGQLAGLETRLEHHLLANHLLKNAKALVFGGLYFEGPDADRWLKTGLRIMTREAAEQILPDGGHFERSPMYHCIVLEDYLDVLNLARSNPGRVPAEAEAILTAAAVRALRFLTGITAGDGRIPLFNDSAFGIVAEPEVLLAYGRRVLGEAGVVAPVGASTRIFFPDTGYFGYRDGGESFIIDCGPVGPDYQPGHAHCDTLGYELCVDGRRIIVDTGVPDYEVGPTRQLVRGTAAHNTVQVDGAEQSEIWGAFRVARRARPLRAELGPWQGDRLEFRGAHDGYRRLSGRLTYERRVVVERGRSWSVFDLITGTGSGTHRAASYVHFGHDCTVEAAADVPGALPRFILRQHGNDKLVMRLTVTCGSTARLVPGYTFPEFGVRLANQALVIERQGALPLEMHYKIERL